MIDIPTDMAVRLAKAKKALEGFDEVSKHSLSAANAECEWEEACNAVADDLIARNFHLMTEQIERLR